MAFPQPIHDVEFDPDCTISLAEIRSPTRSVTSEKIDNEASDSARPRWPHRLFALPTLAPMITSTELVPGASLYTDPRWRIAKFIIEIHCFPKAMPMSTVQMRPTFLLETKLSTEETMQRIKDFVLAKSNPHDASDAHSASPEALDFQGQFTRDHALITICENKRHFWSPWMHLEVRNTNELRHVAGRFSPHPSIWTGFIFSYLTIGVLVFFAMMFGVSQQLSNQTPWAYYFIPAGLLFALVLWVASKAGQRLAYDEMEQMKTLLEEYIRS